MVQITDSEKEILKEWVPGVDLSKVKIRTGLVAKFLCVVLGASAVTLGHSIFTWRGSSIAKRPAGHPLRLGLLAHELYHVKQEKEMGLPLFFFRYIPTTIVLGAKGCVAKKSIRQNVISWYVADRHPLEKPAYEIQRKFLEKHWTQEEARKWVWRPENER